MSDARADVVRPRCRRKLVALPLRHTTRDDGVARARKDERGCGDGRGSIDVRHHA